MTSQIESEKFEHTEFPIPSSYQGIDVNDHQDQENVQSSISSTVSSLVSGIKSVAFDVSSYWVKRLCDCLLSSQDPQSYYKHLMEIATNYEQWSGAATILDQLQGNDKWKHDINSPDYDYELIQRRLLQLKKARKTGDLSQMIFLLRTSLARNLGDMGQPKLYAHTHIGTKKLIEAYINEVVKQLNIICDTESHEISIQAKLEFFTNTRQSFGRTALLLSGGGTFGLTHIGVIKCLYECKILPRVISGASSGSIIAALLCTKTDEEIPISLAKMASPEFDLNVFEKPSDPDTWLRRLHRFLKEGVVFDVEVFRESMRHNIPDMTFQEAYNRTRRALNITVSSSTVYEMPRLLNYLTAPNVLIWSAVAASCSVPFIYNSAPLMAKDRTGKIVPWNLSGNRWIDGSVENDLPMMKLSELFNVNHFIVCQVNPHVVPFLQNNLIVSPTNQIVEWFLSFAISELQHRLSQLSELGMMENLIHRFQAIMSQRYCGDITIIPNINYMDFLGILTNPTPESIKEAALKGERATWPKVSIIHNHCQIELALDEIVNRLRSRKLDPSYTKTSETIGNRGSESKNDDSGKKQLNDDSGKKQLNDDSGKKQLNDDSGKKQLNDGGKKERQLQGDDNSEREKQPKNHNNENEKQLENDNKQSEDNNSENGQYLLYDNDNDNEKQLENVNKQLEDNNSEDGQYLLYDNDNEKQLENVNKQSEDNISENRQYLLYNNGEFC